MYFEGEIESILVVENIRGGTAEFLSYNIQKGVWLVLEWKLVLYANATKSIYEHQAQGFSEVGFLKIEVIVHFRVQPCH